MKIKVFFLVTFMAILCILGTGCKTNKMKYVKEDQELMSKLVYNKCVEDDESFPIAHVNRSEKFSDQFGYSTIRVFRSFGFTASFHFVMKGYLDNYVIGEPVKIVVAQITLSTKKHSFETDMIILNYKSKLIGFLSPIRERINESHQQVIKKIFFFDSTHFLTPTSIIKEESAITYGFYIFSYNNTLQSFGVHCETISQEKKFYVPVVEEQSYRELGSNELVNQSTFMDKIEVEAVVKKVDVENKLCYVACKKISSIQTVSSLDIINSNGASVNFAALEQGNKIIIYYYQRHIIYRPVNIFVDYITVKLDDCSALKPEEIYLDTPYEGRPNKDLEVGEYHWYEFTAPEDGVYRFEAKNFGREAIFIEAFSAPVCGQSIEGRISYSNTRYDKIIFRVVVTQKRGEKIYIRVHGDEYNLVRIYDMEVLKE